MNPNKVITGVYSHEAMLVQKALLETVEPNIVVDGYPGPKTLEALNLFALAHGLPATKSFAGPAWDLLVKYIDNRFTGDEAFKQAAATLGCPQSYIRAVAEVESRGNGFLAKGRVKLLFERHKFYKYLGERLNIPEVRARVQEVLQISVPKTGPDLLNLVVNKMPDICNSTAGGYLGGLAEHDRLEKAVALDATAAYMSASYGMYQIMGFNHTLAGYLSAQDMYISFSESEKNQFMGFVNFIKNNANIHSALKKGDWLGFAKGYNGAAFATNDYNVKTAAAERKYRIYN